MRRLGVLHAGLLGGVLALAASMSAAMGQVPLGREVTVACRAGNGKVVLPEGICTLFIERLRIALPDKAIDEGRAADLTLVVARLGQNQITARIDQGKQSGQMLAMTRRDAALDEAAYIQFFDGLIAATLPR